MVVVMSLVEIVVPGAGPIMGVLDQMGTLCDEMKEGKDTCKRMHQRLSDILTALQKMEANNQLPTPDALRRYTEVVRSSLAYLDKYAHMPFISRMIKHREMVDEIRQIHEEIDALMMIFNLAPNGAMMQWKQEWEEAQDAVMATLTHILGNNDLVLRDLQSQKDQQNAIYLLVSKLQQPDTSAQTRESAKKMLDAIIRTSGAKIPAIPKWFIPQDDLVYDTQPFDRGSFGALHRGMWGSGTRVVVKTLLLDDMEQHTAKAMHDQFVREAELWFSLNHPHVVKMYGACHIATPPFIVCEDATNGNLASYLQRRGQGSMWKLLYQSALGIQHLHRNRVVHGDLKLTNLLVGADGAARVADFGLSVVRRPSMVVSSQEALEAVSSPSDGGGLRWRAPECFTGQATFASDVYSLAMCMIEAVSGEPPYGYVDDNTVIEKKRNGEIPSQPSECPDEGWKLIVSMTACDPRERAKLEDVIKALKTLTDAHDTPSSYGLYQPDGFRATKTESRLAHTQYTSSETRATPTKRVTVREAQTIDHVEVAMTVMDLVLPGAGPIMGVLDQMGTLCDEMKEGKDTCKRMHQRLSDILTALQKMEANNQLPTPDALRRYTEVVRSSLAYLDKYAHMPFISRMIKHREMVDEIRQIHEEIDALMMIFNLAPNGAMMQWKQEWEEAQDAVMATLTHILGNNDLVLRDLQSQKDQQNAIYLLVSKLQQPDTSAQTRESAKKMLDAIIRTSGAKIPAIPKWFIPQDDLVYDTQPFDRGSFGALHRGMWGSGTRVVVKTLLLDDMEQHTAKAMHDQFVREAELWFSLNHPHVVKMYGACHIATPPFIVCEDATNGNLASYLQRRGQGSMWKLLYQSALGLQHLHANRVVHGDLKLTNLLVGADGAARVADFGLSVVRRPSMVVSSQEALEAVSSPSDGGGLRWRAPECFTGQATFASDVYSLAMCMIEAVSGEPPYGYADDNTVIEKKRNGEIPSQPSECPDEGWKLIVSMTACDPRERAKLEDVIKALKTLTDAHDTPSSYGLYQPDGFRATKTESRLAHTQYTSSETRATPTKRVTVREAQTIDHVEVAMTVMDLVLPGAGPIMGVLDQMGTLCDEMKEGKDTCKRMHQRLSDILTALQKMEANNQLPTPDALRRYTEVVRSSLAYLDKYAHMPFISRMIKHREMVDEIRQIHEEIDALMMIFNLAPNGAMMQWKQEWEEAQDAVMATLTHILGNNDLVLRDLQSQKDQQNAIYLLVSKLQQPDTSAQTRESAKKMLDAIIRTSGAKIPAIPKWFIPQDDLVYDTQPFDRGSFGALHRGMWGSGTRVVVKTLLLDDMEQHTAKAMHDQFVREAELWFSLNHPHVVKMYGACHIATPPFIVCEDATNGNLASYLQRRGQGSMWKLLYQSALGLQHLHANRVVHGDLKLTNLLVGADGAARVADFGLSVVRRPSMVVSSQEALEAVSSPSDGGGLRWRAPECFTGQATFASDVYSLAMCMIEAVSGEPPYGYADDNTVIEKKRNGEIPSQPSECPDEGWELIVSMTACDPRERAKLEDVIKALKRLMKECESSRVIDTQPEATVVQHRESLSPFMRRVSVSSLLQKLDSTDDIERSAAVEEVASRVTKSVKLLPLVVGRGVEKWVDELKHTSTTDEILPRCNILYEIADVNEAHHGAIIRAGGVAVLVSLASDDSVGKVVKAVASSILRCLVSRSYRAHVVDELLQMIQPAIPESKRQGGLYAIELCASTEALSYLMSSDGVSKLLKLIQDGTDNEKERAVSILHKIATTNDVYIDSIRQAGGIDVLNSIAQARESPLQATAVWTIGALTRRSSIARRHPASLSIVPVLVEMARTGDEKKKESAAFALGSLMKSDAVKRVVKQEGGYDVLQKLAKSGSPDQVRYAQRAISNGGQCCLS